MGKCLKADPSLGIVLVAKERVGWSERVVDPLPIEHPAIKPAGVGLGSISWRGREGKDSLLCELSFGATAKSLDSPPTRRVNPDSNGIKLNALLD